VAEKWHCLAKVKDITSTPDPRVNDGMRPFINVGVPSIRLLGVRIDCYGRKTLLRAVSTSVRGGSRITVMYVNVHCMNLCHDDLQYASMLEAADIVYCDGTGVRLGARIAGGDIPERMTGADWIVDLCRVASNEGLSLFLLGGAPGVAQSAAQCLRAKYPGLKILGTASGYELDHDTVDVLNELRPDIVLVGMGSPTQEKWIAGHRTEINAPVLWAVGALFDFVAGRIRRGPAWMTEHGFEWACRLVAEPRKLWRRYVIGNPRFIARVLRERSRRR
jgi:N-acetylglucosaminyldiphosphoundecaprenol N-acetyl-beta-D-mannosaminyltransferase